MRTQIPARLLVGAVMLVALATVGTRIWSGAMSLFKTEYGETVAVAVATRWASEPVSVTWLWQFPLTSSPYGPLYPAAVRVVAAILSPPLFAARVVSLCALALTAFLLAVATIERSGRPSLGALAAIVFATAPTTRMWGYLGRPDMLATCLVVAAYATLRSTGGASIALSVSCLVAAGLTRQVTLLHVIPLAGFVAVQTRSARRGVEYAALVAACSAGV